MSKFVSLHFFSYFYCCSFACLVIFLFFYFFLFFFHRIYKSFFSLFFAEQSNLSPGAIFGILAGVLVAVGIIVVVVVCCLSSKKNVLQNRCKMYYRNGSCRSCRRVALLLKYKVEDGLTDSLFFKL